MLTENKGDRVSGYAAVFMLGYATCAIFDHVPQLKQDKAKLETTQHQILPKLYSQLGAEKKAHKDDEKLLSDIASDPASAQLVVEPKK